MKTTVKALQELTNLMIKALERRVAPTELINAISTVGQAYIVNNFPAPWIACTQPPVSHGKYLVDHSDWEKPKVAYYGFLCSVLYKQQEGHYVAAWYATERSNVVLFPAAWTCFTSTAINELESETN